MKIRDVMVFGTVTVQQDESTADAARLMRDQNIGMLVVEDHGEVLGVVTDRDLLVKCVAPGHLVDRCTVSTHMTRRVVSTEPDSDVFEAVRLMRRNRIRRMPVIEAGELVGMASITDIRSALDEPLRDVVFGTGTPRKVAVSSHVGTVTHYYSHIGVATLNIQRPLHTGDCVRIIGHTTDLSQPITSMEIDHEQVEEATPGDDVAIRVNTRTRPGDNVYMEQPGFR
ncbi:MAG: CBS domain-containing protein [Dehalococcoidia bacterium]